jgi:hypothetical protein
MKSLKNYPSYKSCSHFFVRMEFTSICSVVSVPFITFALVRKLWLSEVDVSAVDYVSL